MINSRQYQRYQIVTLHENNVEKGHIASFVNRDVRTVNRWISRAQSGMNLIDKTRSGRPLVYDEALQNRMVAFYCQTTPLAGAGRWTLRWAQRDLEIDPRPVGAMLQRTTIWRILERQNLKPHRSKYLLQITDPDFFPKMEHLLWVYNNIKENLFSYDECTGIQVLLRMAPNVQPKMSQKQKKGWLEEFEYIRNGTIDLLAFIDVHNGKVDMHCKSDHTKKTFLAVFEKHAQSVSKDERIDYIMDNLASHYCYELCELVAKLSKVQCPDKKKLNNGKKRREWLQSEGKRIAIHFTPFHGSWLNANLNRDFVWNTQCKMFKGIIPLTGPVDQGDLFLCR